MYLKNVGLEPVLNCEPGLEIVGPAALQVLVNTLGSGVKKAPDFRGLF